MDNLTQRWTQSASFFPKSGHFFQFSVLINTPVKLLKMESIIDETNNHIVNDKDLEILVIAKKRKQEMRKRRSLQVSKRFP